MVRLQITSNPWTLCTIEQVESLKSLLRVIPMWSTGFIIMVCLNQTPFGTLQANTMNRHIISLNLEIPSGSFMIFTVVTLTIWIAIYDRVIVPLLTKRTGLSRELNTKLQMVIGLVLSCIAMAISAITESIRRKKAIAQGLEDQPNAVMKMSAMWLVPEYVVLGLAEAINAVGQIEFYNSQFPKSMSSIAAALYTFGMAVSNLEASVLVNIANSVTTKGGKESWLSNNLNKGHLDYYYWILAILGVFNCVYFLVCCWSYGPCESGKPRASHQVDENFEYGNST